MEEPDLEPELVADLEEDEEEEELDEEDELGTGCSFAETGIKGSCSDQGAERASCQSFNRGES